MNLYVIYKTILLKPLSFVTIFFFSVICTFFLLFSIQLYATLIILYFNLSHLLPPSRCCHSSIYYPTLYLNVSTLLLSSPPIPIPIFIFISLVPYPLSPLFFFSAPSSNNESLNLHPLNRGLPRIDQ